MPARSTDNPAPGEGALAEQSQSQNRTPPAGLLAGGLLAQNSRLGSAPKNAPLHQAIALSKPLTASGLRHPLYDFRVGPRCSGKERDQETGLDHFDARYYSAAQGRWTIPDWSARQEPVPYATVTDPQTLNLYAYVRNNPLSKPDLDGHCPGDNPNCQELQPNPATVSPAVKQGVNDSVQATKQKTADDAKGNFHEEGGRSGRDANGNEAVVPAQPGKAADPSKDPYVSIDTSKAADPAKQDTIKGQAEVDWHTHPGGGKLVNDGGQMKVAKFKSEPSPDDRAGATAKLNLVISVGQPATVWVYNPSGPVCTESLDDFNKQK